MIHPMIIHCKPCGRAIQVDGVCINIQDNWFGPTCDFCYEEFGRLAYYCSHPRTVLYRFEIDNHMYSDIPLGDWP